MYVPMKLDIPPDQHEKLKEAVDCGKSVSMKVNIGGGKKSNRHIFLLTNSQRSRLARAKLMNKSSVNIKLSKKQVKVNKEQRGGFLGSLVGLASKILPTLLGGLTTGLISGGIEKAVSGRGVGAGLYLHKSHRNRAGDGLYLTNLAIA